MIAIAGLIAAGPPSDYGMDNTLPDWTLWVLLGVAVLIVLVWEGVKR